MPGVESNQTSSPLWHQPAELHWPNPRWEGSSWVETHNVARIRCRLTNGGNEVYKTVGEFAEITVNIYFRHSSVHGKVEMLSSPSISFYPQGLILDKDSEFLNHSSYTPCLNLQLNVLLPKWALDPKKKLTLKMKKKKNWAGDKNMEAHIPGQMNFIMPLFSVFFMYSTWLLRLWRLQNKN